jgi:uncharacterized membrane protein
MLRLRKLLERIARQEIALANKPLTPALVLANVAGWVSLIALAISGNWVPLAILAGVWAVVLLATAISAVLKWTRYALYLASLRTRRGRSFPRKRGQGQPRRKKPPEGDH